MSVRRRFVSVAAAGVTFQAGSAAVDSATIMSALVFQLTGSPILVGAVTAILRFGWLFPQLIIGRSEEHTSELQSLMRISYAVFCLKKKHKTTKYRQTHTMR